MNEGDFATFVRKSLGVDLVAARRVAAGQSRATYVCELSDGRELVLRASIDGSALGGTELTLAREAVVYRALQDSAVPIPRLLAVAPHGDALLVELAKGTTETPGLWDASLREVRKDYLHRLGQLHAVDADSLELPGISRPRDAGDHSRQEVERWREILRRRTHRPYVTAALAFAALTAADAPRAERTVLCHGDVGPGNYLHDGSRVTAFLDWEFAHLGDPMDDLAGWIFRGYEYPGAQDDLIEQLHIWQQASGLSIRVRDLQFYRAMTLIRWIVVMAASIDSPDRTLSRARHLSLVPATAVQMAAALAQLFDVTLPVPEVPGGKEIPGAEVFGWLRTDLTDVIAPAISSAELQRRVTGATWYVDHLHAVARFGDEVTRLELAELSDLLHTRIGDVADGHRRLCRALDEGTVDLTAAIGYLWAHGHRYVALWPMLAPLDERRLVDLTELELSGAAG